MNKYRLILNSILVCAFITASTVIAKEDIVIETNNYIYTDYFKKPVENEFAKFEGLSNEELFLALLDDAGDKNQAMTSVLDNCSNIGPSVWKYRPSSGLSEYHLGTDYRTKNGSNIYAPLNGYILQEDHSYKNKPKWSAGKWLTGSGNTIYMIAELDGTIYGFIFMHLSEVNVEAGQAVVAGDIIGLSGNSGKSDGPHLHLEVYRLGYGNISDFIYQDCGRSFGCRRGYGGYRDRCSRKQSEPCILNPEDYFN